MNEPSQAELWARFASAAMASDPAGSIETQARWADQMIAEFNNRFAMSIHEGEDYWYLRSSKPA